MARGRPRQFQLEYALDQSTLVFWEKGFVGASLGDLTKAMGINGPSLYAAFGDKKTLYMQCVDRYVEKYGSEPARILNETDSIDDALAGFFLAIVDNITGNGTPLGCLMACTLAESALFDEDVATKLKECIGKTDQLLEQRFALAHREGQLPPGTDPILVAKLANSLRHGMALRARSGASQPELAAHALEAVRLLLGRPAN